MNEIYSSYKNKTVLVTGHTGFKGSWFSIWLNLIGARVIGYSLDPYTTRDNYVLSNISDKIIDIKGDIRDEMSLASVFYNHKPEIVFHFAAQPIVSISYSNPRETYETNFMGTVNLLECARKAESVKVVVIITSDKCYENKELIWGYRENDALGGYDPYSSSKAAVEILVASYRNSFFNPTNFEIHGKSISSVRAGNVIGGGDWSTSRIIPDCIRALEKNISIEVRNPLSIRPWQHVLEPLSGYLLLGAKMLEDGRNYCNAWNFGPDYTSQIAVKNIVQLLIDYWGYGNWKYTKQESIIKNHETNTLYLDCSKSKKILGWYPKLTITEAINLTVDWYKNYNSKDIYELCVNQITQYMENNNRNP